jgi:hypothetical protein
MHFYNAYPSCTGVAYVTLLPESIITAVDLPQENEARTGVLPRKIAGT